MTNRNVCVFREIHIFFYLDERAGLNDKELVMNSVLDEIMESMDSMVQTRQELYNSSSSLSVPPENLYSNERPAEPSLASAVHVGNHNFPVASYEVEADAIRHLIIIQKMNEKGFAMDPELPRRNPRLTMELVESHGRHSFCPDPEKHVCSGGNDSHWKLTELQRFKKKFGVKNHKGGVAEWNEEYARHSRAMQSGCSFSQLKENEPFYHLGDGRTYLATGEVYVCITSGKPHICTMELCRNQITSREDGMTCTLTHKCYGAPMVHVEERDKDGEGRDGGVSYTSAKGGGMWSSTPSLHRKKISKSAQDRATALAEERYNKSNLSEAFKLSLKSEEKCSHLEDHLKETYPRIKYPIAHRAGRTMITEICSALIYDREVRKSIWERVYAEEREIQSMVKTYYTERLAKKKMRNPFHVIEMAARIKPYWDRLATIGFFDQNPDHGVLDYFQAVVITVWTLLHYMPFAQRSVTSVQLTSKHVAAILYKLQNGFYVKVTYDPVSKVITSYNNTASVLPSSSTSSLPIPPPPPLMPSTDPPVPQKKPSLGDLCGKRKLVELDDGESDSSSQGSHNGDQAESHGQDHSLLTFEDALLGGMDPDQKSSAAAERQEPQASVDVTKLICFIPRCRFLQRMPQKSDLNKFTCFKKLGLSSNIVIKTDKIISDCYESLLTQKGVTVDRLLDFALERYINLREFS